MVNIYKYLASPDIAAYCQKIGHVFNPLEMAVIVGISKKTIKEKHAAWREIITEYPDMPIHESLNFEARISLHDFLGALIDWEEKLLEAFYTPGEGMVYRFRVPWRGEWCDKHSGVYSSLDKTWRSLWEEWDREEDKIDRVRIEKGQLDSDNFIQIEAEMNTDGEVLYLYQRNGCPGELEMIFIHLPLPFEKGDIVLMENGKPGVLVNLPHWRNNKLKYENYVSGKRGDGSDMIGCYYFINEDGRLIRDHGYPFSLYRLRYFDGELKDQDRFLTYLSQYIKNEDEDIDWLINVFLKFRAEAESKNIDRLFGGWYRSLDEDTDNQK